MIFSWIINYIIKFFNELFQKPEIKQDLKNLLFKTLVAIVNEFFKDKQEEYS